MKISRNLVNRELTKVRSQMTDEELFSSPSFEALVSTVTEGVTKKFGVPVKAQVRWMSPSDYVAYTMGFDLLALNANNALVQGKSRQERYRLLMAIVLHECGHRLFTDFSYFERFAEEAIKTGVLPCAPRASKMLAKLSHGQRRVVMRVFHSITNMIEDAFIELVLMRMFPGYGAYLAELREVQLAEADTVEEEVRSGLTFSARLFNLILTYAKYSVVKVENQNTLQTDEVCRVFTKVKGLIDSARVEKSYKARVEASAKIFDELVDVLFKAQNQQAQGQQAQSNSDEAYDKKSSASKSEAGSSAPESEGQPEDQSEGSSEGSDADSAFSSEGEGDGEGESLGSKSELSDDEASSLAQNLDALNAPLDAGQTSRIRSSVKATQECDMPENDEEVKAKSKADMSEFDKAETEAAKAKALSNLEKEVQKEVAAEAAKTSTGGFHELVSLEWRSIPTTKPADYDALEAGVKTVFTTLCKQFSKQIKNRLEYSFEDGLYYGERLADASRRDMRRFSNRNIPEENFDMAVCLYIDLSGSMGDALSSSSNTLKWEVARATAVLMTKFCNELNIPLQIVGHSTGRANPPYQDSVLLSLFKDYDSVDGLELARVSNLEQMIRGCNRDGYGLRICADGLVRRKEKCKLLFIVSDGEPNGRGGYSFDVNWNSNGEAKKDIDDILITYGRKGVRFVTAGMGECACKNVRALYQDGLSPKIAAKFIDITDMDTMPRAFVNIVKKYLDN